MRQGIIIGQKLCERISKDRKIFRGLMEHLIMYAFGKFLAVEYMVWRGFLHTLVTSLVK